MFKKIIISFSLLFFISCSSLYDWLRYDDNYEVKTKLRVDNFDKLLQVKIMKKGDYEMYMPLHVISSFIYFKSDHRYRDFLNRINNLLNESLEKKRRKINLPDWIDPNRWIPNFNLSLRSVFRSGYFYIYDTKNEKYIYTIRIKESSWYGGPLAAAIDFVVYIDDFLLWERHIYS